jgi:hypothetical protein
MEINIRHTEISAEKDNPFKNCRLGREMYARTLTHIIGNYKTGFVMAINNEWGTGKTTFMKMWQEYLKNENFNTLYFNAWENDFELNPLTAIISELKAISGETDTKKAFKELTKKGAVIAKNIIPELLKALAKNYIGGDIIPDLIKNSSEAGVDIFEKEIENYDKKKKGLIDFKRSLQSFIAATENEKPLVFIIDELDRCRPNYSVELLEQIKHLFSVPGIVFVLSIDKIQLGYAIKGFYGNDKINSDEYLRRFIDVEYSLPTPNIKDFCVYLFEYFQFDSFFKDKTRVMYQEYSGDGSALITAATLFFKKENLSLRQQEKVFAHARIALSFFNVSDPVFVELFLYLIICNHYKKEFYNTLNKNEEGLQKTLTDFAASLPATSDKGQIDMFTNMSAIFTILCNNSKNATDVVLKRPDGTEYINLNFLLNGSDQQYFNSEVKNYTRNWRLNSYNLRDLLNKINLTENVQIN